MNTLPPLNTRDVSRMEACQGVYEDPKIVADYERRQYVLPEEKILFDRYKVDFHKKRVLEIGVGAGRLAARLSEGGGSYVGVDISEPMIEACRRRFPRLHFMRCDVRCLTPFEPGSFDTVVFSLNGLDHLLPDDRRLALKEIYRVLHEGGLFVFSSHNLDWPRPSPLTPPKLHMDWRPWRMWTRNAREVGGYLMGLGRHLLRWRSERWFDGYAILNDQAHGYRTMMHFIRRESQMAQLHALGFSECRAFDRVGRELTGDDPCRDPWIYYASRAPSS